MSVLYWVVPQEAPLTSQDLIQLLGNLTDSGLAADSVDLTLNNGIIGGRVGRLEVHIVPLPALPRIGQDTVVQVSLDFFLPLFGTPVRTRTMELLGKFYKTVEDRGLADRPTFITVVSGNAEFPAANLFWATALASLYESTDNFSSRLWWGLDELLHQEFFFQSEASLEFVESLLGQYPGQPSLLFHRALNLARIDEWGAASQDALAAAAGDPLYRFGCLELARYMIEKRSLGAARDLLDKVVQSFPAFQEAAALRSTLESDAR